VGAGPRSGIDSSGERLGEGPGGSLTWFYFNSGPKAADTPIMCPEGCVKLPLPRPDMLVFVVAIFDT